MSTFSFRHDPACIPRPRLTLARYRQAKAEASCRQEPTRAEQREASIRRGYRQLLALERRMAAQRERHLAAQRDRQARGV